jgi:thiamine pyrophosphate-dependent acetolactate synthase large subunit-like protein
MADGSIQMCIQELSTCGQYGLPIKIINLNNRALGMVKQWQDIPRALLLRLIIFIGNPY